MGNRASVKARLFSNDTRKLKKSICAFLLEISHWLALGVFRSRTAEGGQMGSRMKRKRLAMNNLNHSRILAARLFAAALLLVSAGSALAAVRYVDVNSTNATPPYTNWATAATNIQDAVDAAVAGDEIVVTNGIYATGGRTIDGTTTNRVAVDKPLSLRSVNGPQFTTIDGGHSNRCVYLTNGASLSGFTLTNGRAHVGGGLWCESTNAVVSNCVVSGNSSFGYTISCLGSVFHVVIYYPAFAGGVYGGTLNNCTLSDNWAETHSFPGFPCDSSTCTTFSGVGAGLGTYYSLGAGGGAANATLNNCTLTANSAAYGGGAYGCTLNNCTLTGNTAAYSMERQPRLTAAAAGPTTAS